MAAPRKYGPNPQMPCKARVAVGYINIADYPNDARAGF